MSKKAAELEVLGRQALADEDYALAESLLLQALAEDDDPSIRNNLALVYYLMEKPEIALEKLEDGLSGNIANPFGRALGAQCLVALDQMMGAKRMAAEAVRDFDTGLHIMQEEQVAIPDSWREYTVMIMRAVGAVGDHRQVLEIYRRWQQLHVTCECRYLAGIAAFNLRRFRQAASYWAGLEQEYFNAQLQLVGVMADKGVIPPFTLEYDLFHKAGLACYRGAKTEDALRAAIGKNGLLRLFLLIMVVNESADEKMKKTALEAIVLHGSGWGQDVGLAFLQSPMADDKLKVTAAEALVKAGVFAEGEEIPLMMNGRLQAMKILQVQVTWEPPEAILADYEQALSLREQGKVKKAILLLEAQRKGSVIYPPAMLALANLYRTEKMVEKALPVFEMLESIAPDHPIILFNLAAFWLGQNNQEKAMHYLERIDPELGNEEFRNKYRWLKFEIEGMSYRFFSYDDFLRHDIEEKKLVADPSMGRGLRNMPIQWVRKACAFWNVDCKTRKEGEAALVAAVTSPAAVRRAVLQLTAEESELLVYLLKRGGQAGMSAVVRKFGAMDKDGFLVNEPPQSVMGKLWLKGLIFVGRAKIKNRKVKIVTVAVELREALAELLSV
jgi:tetratricopeptide (TPR) repeat protein